MGLSDIRGRFFLGRTRAERRFGVVLLLVAIGLAVLLRIGGSEWREAAPERMAKSAKRYAEEGRHFADEAERDRQLFKSLKREHFVKTGLYWAALVNLILSAGLFFTRPLWIGSAVESGSEAGRAPPGRGFWIAVALAILVGGALRAPRMDLSLYNDEAYSFRHYIHGQFKEDKAGGKKFEAVPWADTFWKSKANNGVPFSVLARLAHGDAAPGEVRESRLRLGALVPGLLSIGASALLGWWLFGGPAGGATAWILALHPWHLRYCTEARPYGLVLFFAALGLWCLALALQRNRWPAWLGFALCEFGLLWSYAGALYFAIGLNLAALFFLIRRRIAPGRWFVSGLLAAMLFLQLMAPNFPQMAFVLGSVDSFKEGVRPVVVADIFSYLATGMPAFDADPANAFNPALPKAGWLLLLLGLPALAAIAWSSLAALRGSALGKVLVWGNVLALIVAIGASAASCGVLHRWYVIYLLPMVALLAGVGLARMWAERKLRSLAVVAAAGALILAQLPLRSYLSHPKEDLRGIAATTAEGGAISAGLWTNAGVYDPEMVQIRAAEDLHELIGRAGSEGRPLRVALAHRDIAALDQPESVQMLESGDFELVAEFPGLEEEQFTARIYELKK